MLFDKIIWYQVRCKHHKMGKAIPDIFIKRIVSSDITQEISQVYALYLHNCGVKAL